MANHFQLRDVEPVDLELFEDCMGDSLAELMNLKIRATPVAPSTANNAALANRLAASPPMFINEPAAPMRGT